VKRAGALALALECWSAGLPAQQRAHVHPTIQVGSSYTSAEALGEPAGFALSKEQGGPWLTTLDAGGLISGGAANSWYDFGVRAAAGSTRARSKRIYGTILRYNRLAGPLVLALSGEYVADGGFDVQKGVLNFEATPFAVPSLAIGIPWHGFRWRPWLAAGYGNVFKTSAAAADVEQDGFVRLYARAELVYVFGPVQLNSEATSWIVDGAVSGNNYVKGALSLGVGSGFSVELAGELGRQPPRFEHAGRLAIGLGYQR